MSWWKQKFENALKPRVPKKREPSIYATFYERLMASGIDIALLYIVLKAPLKALSNRIYSHITPENQILIAKAQSMPELYHNAVQSGFVALWLLNFALQMILIGILLVGFQIWLQTTPGKWIMGLKVTTADNETPPAAWRLIVRYFAYGIACAPLMIGIVWMNIDKQRRGWHDWIAGTRVITLRPQGWYWAQAKRLFAKLRNKA